MAEVSAQLQAENKSGCLWVVGKVKRWRSKERRYDMAPVFCHKMTAEGSTFCPRHDLMNKLKVEETAAQTYVEGR
jgi:hypothetical protein